MIPSLSLILSGAGSLQVRVMEILLRCAMRRSCGGPVGTEMEEEKEVRNSDAVIVYLIWLHVVDKSNN